MPKDGKLREKTRKEFKRLREEFEVGGFTAQKGVWNIAAKRMVVHCPKKKVTQ